MAYNTASTSLYIQNGMYPREPLLRLAASGPVVAARIGTLVLRSRINDSIRQPGLGGPE
jgi:hypothetical protein